MGPHFVHVSTRGSEAGGSGHCLVGAVGRFDGVPIRKCKCRRDCTFRSHCTFTCTALKCSTSAKSAVALALFSHYTVTLLSSAAALTRQQPHFLFFLLALLLLPCRPVHHGCHTRYIHRILLCPGCHGGISSFGHLATCVFFSPNATPPPLSGACLQALALCRVPLPRFN